MTFSYDGLTWVKARVAWFTLLLLGTSGIGCTMSNGESSQSADSRIDIAVAELNRLRVDPSGRRVSVTDAGPHSTVTFHAPDDQLSGDFIVTIDDASEKVVSARVWR